MANDSGHFIDHEEIAPQIKERRAALAVLPDGRQFYPLYEGKMFWHFDHRYGTYEDQTEKQANKGVLPRVTKEQHADPLYQIQPRYWIDASLTEAALSEEASHRWFFTWRDLGPSERSLVGTIIPRSAAGHKAPLMICDHSPADRVILATVLSGLATDYAVRQKTNAMTFFVMEQAAVLSRKYLSEPVAWLGDAASDWLLPRALELFYTNDELYALCEDLGRTHPPFLWNEERRYIIQAEIDAAMFHLYRLNREQVDWVLDSFTVLRKYEERDHNEFRTKRLVLAAYDAMAEAKVAGTAYVSPLSPPPADPSLCHDAVASQNIPALRPIELPPLGQVPDAAWGWPEGVNERDRVRAQLRAVAGVLPGPSDARRVRLAALACLQPGLLDGFLTEADRREWQRLMPRSTGVTQLVPPTNAAWGAAFNELVSSAVLDVSSDGTQWSAGSRLDRSTLDASYPAVGRAIFAWSRLEGVDLDHGLEQVSAVILPFIREGRLAA
ncbi:hypothetical protein D3C77_207820 [compost metagenome]